MKQEPGGPFWDYHKPLPWTDKDRSRGCEDRPSRRRRVFNAVPCFTRSLRRLPRMPVRTSAGSALSQPRALGLRFRGSPNRPAMAERGPRAGPVGGKGWRAESRLRPAGSPGAGGRRARPRVRGLSRSPAPPRRRAAPPAPPLPQTPPRRAAPGARVRSGRSDAAPGRSRLGPAGAASLRLRLRPAPAAAPPAVP